VSERALVVLGDTVLDRDIDGRVGRLCPDAPVPVLEEATESVRAGGAGLAATIAAADGVPVRLVTALSGDAPGRLLADLLDEAGVEVVDMGLEGPTPEKIRLRCDGRTLLRQDRNCASRPRVRDPLAGGRAFADAGAIVVSDYGRGITSEADVRRAVGAAAPSCAIVWDPHLNGREPVAGTILATPNRTEAAALVPHVRGGALRAEIARAQELRARWKLAGVSVTLGEQGALLVHGPGSPEMFPAPSVTAVDTCGAGDRFASAAASALIGGATLAEAVDHAVRQSAAYVSHDGDRAGDTASSAADAVGWAAAERIAATVRSRDGVVVTTGGCFDLLHAGHVNTLEAARALGDCLIVLVNSDSSVRALKGPARPVVRQADRARVLASLHCVDAVVVFDEPTPETALMRLQPDVFAKGGDYEGGPLLEEATLRRFGGQAVVLPLVSGRSTTEMIRRAVETRGA
jgi:D-beta-D-heptose 7-phosphate kinase / D-beta-D-heptose 1-phosphate adenosyltransferase